MYQDYRGLFLIKSIDRSPNLQIHPQITKLQPPHNPIVRFAPHSRLQRLPKLRFSSRNYADVGRQSSGGNGIASLNRPSLNARLIINFPRHFLKATTSRLRSTVAFRSLRGSTAPFSASLQRATALPRFRSDARACVYC